jgi:hypothetical protein
MLEFNPLALRLFRVRKVCRAVKVYKELVDQSVFKELKETAVHRA